MKERILAIDDDEIIRVLAMKTLSHFGYEVSVAENGPDGLRLMEEKKPDLILLDIMMPEMDGIEVLRKIKKNPQFAQIPVIMFTAITERGTVVEAIRLGALDYIMKPFRGAVLRDRIENVLGSRGPSDEGTDLSVAEQEVKDRYRLLVFTLDLTLVNMFSAGVASHYEVRCLPQTGQIVKGLISFGPDFVLIDWDTQDLAPILSIMRRIRKEREIRDVGFYLIAPENMREEQTSKLQRMGFVEFLHKPIEPHSVEQRLHELFAVNLVDVSRVKNVTILTRRPVDTPLAGREMLRRVLYLARQNKRRIIVDLSVLDEIGLEELGYIGKFANSQTRLGIEVRFVIPSNELETAFWSFHETQKVALYPSCEDALEDW